MIFVTLGTHEQPFDRIIIEINRLIKKGAIEEEVFMQVGYRYNTIPVCPYEQFLSMTEMNDHIKKARVVVVHGGLGSIMQAFINKKVPVVVPRQSQFGEHVDDHQLLFSKRIADDKKIIAVFDIEELGDKLLNYSSELTRLGISGDPGKDIEKRSKIFASKLDKICRELVKKTNNDI